MKKIFAIAIFTIPILHSNFANDYKAAGMLVPDFALVQFAGNIGVLSGGVGYSFLDNKILSSISYGYVPHFIGGTTIHTIAWRNNFQLYSWNLNQQNNLIAYANAGINIEPGDHSLLKIPERFPEGYYASNSFHYPIGLGFRIDTQKSEKIFGSSALFLEAGTLVTYLYYEFKAKKPLTENIVTLSFGIVFFL